MIHTPAPLSCKQVMDRDEGGGDDDGGEPGAVQRGEAECGREMEDEKETEQAVRSATDLEQLGVGGGNVRHDHFIDRYGDVPWRPRSLACQVDLNALQGRNRA
jgi:hypothetical protein